MWVMQQLGRRAGALDVDLKSHRHRLGEMMLLSSSALELDVRDAAMFEGRVAQVDPISLLSTGGARGGKLVTVNVFDLCEGYSSSLYVHLSTLSSAVSLSVKLFSSPPS